MEERNYCLYYHKSPSGKIYVGITNDIKTRWSGKGSHYKPCKCFYNAIKCYGWDNIEHHIMHENLTLKEASTLEKIYIRLWGTLAPSGYNLSEGGSNGNPMIGKTEEEIKEWKKKLSDSHKGKTLSEETKKKMSEGKKGDKHHMYGKHHAEKTKKKIGEGNKGKIISEENKKKLSERFKGDKNPMYGKGEHFKGDKNPMYGKGESIKGDKNPNAHKVKVYDKKGKLINEYGAISIACEKLGLEYKRCVGNINKCANGKIKSAYGYIWEY